MYSLLNCSTDHDRDAVVWPCRMKAACKALSRMGKITVLESVCSPALVPLLPARLAQLSTPFGKDGFLQAHKVAVLLVVGVGKSPRELPADDAGFVKIGADDGKGKEWRFFLFGILRFVSADGICREPLRMTR